MTNMGTKRKFRFSLGLTLAVTILAGSLFGFWVDMPRRTAIALRKRLAAGDLAAANSMLVEPARFVKPEGTSMLYVVTELGGVPCGTAQTWVDASIECQPCNIRDYFLRRRSAKITNLRPNSNGVTFKFEGSSVVVLVLDPSLQ
jgi:hypothetical protein